MNQSHITNPCPPTIWSFASPKGGVGKSTSCVLVAAALAKRGHRVLVLDLDVNKSIANWVYRFPDETAAIKVEVVKDTQLLERISKLYNSYAGYILIDVAGVLDIGSIAAASVADITITPTNLSDNDVLAALMLNREMEALGRRINKPIHHRILVNDVSPLLRKYQEKSLHDIVESGVPRFKTMLLNRTAYGELWANGLAPHYANQNNEWISKAVAQVDELVDELLAFEAQDTNQQKVA